MTDDLGDAFDAPPPGQFLPAGPVQRLSHEAMNTTFELILRTDDPAYAASAAAMCWDELDRLELELSRFNEASDVFQLGLLPPGGSLRVGLDVFRCLEIARDAWRATDGAFDPACGALRRCRRDDPADLADARARSGMDKLHLDADSLSVRVDATGVELDLGGVGKGYAVDRLAELLGEWSLGDGLVRAGESTVYALGTPGNADRWPLPLRHPADAQRAAGFVHLRDAALAVSGVQQQGAHVIDPRTAAPAGQTWAAAIAPTAAEADALATAFLVLSRDNVERLCAERDLAAVLTGPSAGDAGFHRIGLPG